MNYEMIDPIKIETQYVGYIQKIADIIDYPNNRKGRRKRKFDKKPQYK